MSHELPRTFASQDPLPGGGDAAGARHCRHLRDGARWATKLGRDYARRLRRKKPGPRNVWHLDEVVVSIGGQKDWLLRAVDQDGDILDEIVQARRATKATAAVS